MCDYVQLTLSLPFYGLLVDEGARRILDVSPSLSLEVAAKRGKSNLRIYRRHACFNPFIQPFISEPQYKGNSNSLVSSSSTQAKSVIIIRIWEDLYHVIRSPFLSSGIAREAKLYTFQCLESSSDFERALQKLQNSLGLLRLFFPKLTMHCSFPPRSLLPSVAIAELPY